MTLVGRFTLERVDEIDSTSSELMRRAVARPASIPEVGVALLATRQTGGRGRSGRDWRSLEGNLNLSVSLDLADMRAPGHWSLMAAVALLDALRRCVPDRAGLGVKWPNDILLDGRKLAGILLETVPLQDSGLCLVIGFGVNLVAAPADLGRAVACLADTGIAPAVDAVAKTVLASLSEWIVGYEADGFEPIRAAWLAAGHRPGDSLSVMQGRQELQGTFTGITPEGALQLHCDSGSAVITAGEVFAAPRCA